MRTTYRCSLLLLDFINRVTDVLTLKHHVSEAGCFPVFREEALNLLHPLDQVFLSYWVSNWIACSKWSNRLGSFSLRTEAEPASETWYFSVYMFVSRWAKSKRKRLYLCKIFCWFKCARIWFEGNWAKSLSRRLYWPQDKLIALQHDYITKEYSLSLYKLINVGYTRCWSRMEWHYGDLCKTQ
jgi:hypothetical protein